MQRDETSREIIRKFEKDVYELYKSAWKQIDDLYDDEYEQNLSVPWFTQLLTCTLEKPTMPPLSETTSSSSALVSSTAFTALRRKSSSCRAVSLMVVFTAASFLHPAISPSL